MRQQSLYRRVRLLSVWLDTELGEAGGAPARSCLKQKGSRGHHLPSDEAPHPRLLKKQTCCGGRRKALSLTERWLKDQKQHIGLFRMEDSQQWGPPDTSPGTSFIVDIFICPKEKGVNRNLQVHRLL